MLLLIIPHDGRVCVQVLLPDLASIYQCSTAFFPLRWPQRPNGQTILGVMRMHSSGCGVHSSGYVCSQTHVYM